MAHAMAVMARDSWYLRKLIHCEGENVVTCKLAIFRLFEKVELETSH